MLFNLYFRYIYTRNLCDCIDKVAAVICLAEKYDVKALKSTCEEYMINNIVRAAKCDVIITWYQYAARANLKRLRSDCEQFIVLNFDTIIASEEWVDLDKDEIINLLKNDNIVVENEYVIFEAMEKWLHHEPRAEKRRENLAEMLPHVRFPLIHPRHLTEIEISDTTSTFGDILTPFTLDAYRYHAVARQFRKETHFGHMDKTNFSARNYVGSDDRISTDIKINNFKKMEKAHSRKTCLVQCAISGSFADSNGAQRMCFALDFYPKGFYRPTKRPVWPGYSSSAESKDTNLSLTWTNVIGSADITLSVLVYARKHGVKYVAYSLTESATLSDENPSIRFKNVINLRDVMAADSAYVIDGALDVRVVIRVLKFNFPNEVQNRVGSFVLL